MAYDFAAGCIGGCAGVIVGHPLDTVKVRLQTQDFKNPVYRGAWHCFKTILKNESVKGLYKGVTSPLAGVGLINAVVFGTYGIVQRYYDGGNLYSQFIAGAAAGLLQSLICSPMELAKIRLQVEKGKSKCGSLDCLIKIWQKQRIRGMYKGFSMTALRDTPAYGVYFFTYELLTGGKHVSTLMMMFSGGVAGMASWLAVYPSDVIKSRLQSDGMNGPSRYKNSLHCLRLSIQEEGGYSFLTRGLFSTCVRAFPVNAVTFTVVTWLLRFAELIPTYDKQPLQQPQQQYKLINHISFKELFTNSIHLFEDGAV
uniref:Mitochondrial basic amino acids transporter n=1 Tax=Panstrongylus lignarius TaxID=156445 RepID=A0A224XGD7_9HEMI